MDGRIETWKFGAIVGGVVGLLVLIIVLVITITLLRKYLQNKQRKHYSQQVEDGTTTAAAGNAASLSRITFGVLWSLGQGNGKRHDNRTSSQINNDTSESVKPHAFAMATEPKSLSSSDLQMKSEDTIKVTATDPPATVDHMTQVPGSAKDVSDGEAFYYELEKPVEDGLLQLPRISVNGDLTTRRHHSSNSYTSISSDVQKLPPPPSVFPPHRRGRRYSLPNNLLQTAQSVAIDNPNYVNYRYGRRNSDPSVTMLHASLFIPGTASPAEYEKPLSTYMPLDLSNVAHHSYTPLNISNDPPNISPELVMFPRQQLSMRTRLPVYPLRMNSIPEENNYEKLQQLPKPSLFTSHDPQ